MKPRIYRDHASYPLHGSVMVWRCVGNGMTGIGSTPKTAYQSWLMSFDAMRNVAYPSVQNYSAEPARGSWWDRLMGWS